MPASQTSTPPQTAPGARPRPQPLLTPSGLPAITDWSLDPAVRHLNHGSFGGVPLAAQRAQAAYRATMDANPCGWFPMLHERVAAARADIAAHLGADTAATALVPNASAGAAVVFAGVPARPGMRIVTTDHGYGAVVMGAERLARRWGGSVTTVRIPLDATEDEAYEAVAAEMTPDVALVVIDQITSATARELPAGRVAAHGRRLGIPVLVDAAHAPGLVAAPLAGVDADFWVGNLHKFSCAPRGTAALVTSGPHTDALHPTIDSWGARLPFPERFDHQGTLDVTSYLAAPVAFAAVEEHYGWDEARRYLTELADYAEDIVARALSEATGADASAEVGCPVNGLRLVRLPEGLATDHADAHALRQELSARLGVETAVTTFGGRGFVRLSTHVYNTAEDFEDFVERCVPFLVARARATAGR
ncbi:aminotransferase class V-fold PLP-dependent enzyme [Kitasatospora sp. NPDC057015]|uniref:aminotransferase class V-fold PLP-dependent enzyme n=1 Tax=Kitasatospora sp. NPDC057015 TaxID=3346001 RepID=UPI00362AEB13